jgi:hypothetical protein
MARPRPPAVGHQDCGAPAAFPQAGYHGDSAMRKITAEKRFMKEKQGKNDFTK